MLCWYFVDQMLSPERVGEAFYRPTQASHCAVTTPFSRGISELAPHKIKPIPARLYGGHGRWEYRGTTRGRVYWLGISWKSRPRTVPFRSGDLKIIPETPRPGNVSRVAFLTERRRNLANRLTLCVVVAVGHSRIAVILRTSLSPSRIPGTW